MHHQLQEETMGGVNLAWMTRTSELLDRLASKIEEWKYVFIGMCRMTVLLARRSGKLAAEAACGRIANYLEAGRPRLQLLHQTET